MFTCNFVYVDIMNERICTFFIYGVHILCEKLQICTGYAFLPALLIFVMQSIMADWQATQAARVKLLLVLHKLLLRPALLLLCRRRCAEGQATYAADTPSPRRRPVDTTD
jgi:hypothetical protein